MGTVDLRKKVGEGSREGTRKEGIERMWEGKRLRYKDAERDYEWVMLGCSSPDW